MDKQKSPGGETLWRGFSPCVHSVERVIKVHVLIFNQIHVGPPYYRLWLGKILTAAVNQRRETFWLTFRQSVSGGLLPDTAGPTPFLPLYNSPDVPTVIDNMKGGAW